MKKFLLIALLLVSAASIAQSPTGLPTKYPNKWYQFGQYVTVDSGLGLAIRDTNWTPSRAGFIIFKSQDKNYYGWNGTKWTSLGSSLIGAINGLTKTGDNIKLGGTLTEPTIITANGNPFTINNGGGSLSYNGQALTLTSSNGINAHIGRDAGSYDGVELPGLYNYSLGLSAMRLGSGNDKIGIGVAANIGGRGSNVIAIGSNTLNQTDSSDIIGIGAQAGRNTYTQRAVLIGAEAGGGVPIASATFSNSNVKIGTGKIGGLASFVTTSNIDSGYAMAFKIVWNGTPPNYTPIGAIDNPAYIKGTIKGADTLEINIGGIFADQGSGTFTITSYTRTDNIVAIGNKVTADQSNQVALGNTSTTQLKAGNIRFNTATIPSVGEVPRWNGTEYVPDTTSGSVPSNVAILDATQTFTGSNTFTDNVSVKSTVNPQLLLKDGANSLKAAITYVSNVKTLALFHNSQDRMTIDSNGKVTIASLSHSITDTAGVGITTDGKLVPVDNRYALLVDTTNLKNENGSLKVHSIFPSEAGHEDQALYTNEEGRFWADPYEKSFKNRSARLSNVNLPNLGRYGWGSPVNEFIQADTANHRMYVYTNGNEAARVSEWNHWLFGNTIDNTIGKVQVHGKLTVDTVLTGSNTDSILVIVNNEVRKVAPSSLTSSGTNPFYVGRARMNDSTNNTFYLTAPTIGGFNFLNLGGFSLNNYPANPLLSVATYAGGIAPHYIFTTPPAGQSEAGVKIGYKLNDSIPIAMRHSTNGLDTTYWIPTTKQLTYTLGTLTDGATITWDYAVNKSVAKVILNGSARTLSITNLPVGEVVFLTLEVEQGATGGTITTYPASVKWRGGTAPTFSSGVGKIDVIAMMWDGTNLISNYASY